MRSLALGLCLLVAVCDLSAAEYLEQTDGGTLLFRCDGPKSGLITEVKYTGYGRYQVKGPRLKQVIQAEDAQEAAVESCGEKEIGQLIPWFEEEKPETKP